MLGLDDRIADLAAGGGAWLALGVALLLGLRHATDPDHLTAVSTLVLSEGRHGTRRALSLGLSWGAGHAVALLALGIPLVLFRDRLPAAVQTAAEVAIAVVIVALAVRLLIRWRRGHFHAHPHRHDGVWHAHPHVHEHGRGHPHAHTATHREAPAVHDHAHPEALGRSPGGAFGIGLVHGIGGTAGAGLLLVAAVPGESAALVALVVLAVATALSMAACSAGFGHVLAHGRVARRLVALVPIFGLAGAVFGVWYGLGALGTVPYVF
ncbi:MAG TPA: hypothetical protein VK387_03485 [Thermoleophilaceae bacterium]|nr:hypothetical protein [Thermoleophilaceae bacterium]